MSAIRIYAAVLAGGKSSRMKTDKRFLKIHGELLVDRAVRLANEATTEFGGKVFLCGEVPGRQCLPDSISGIGPLSGLLSALEIVADSKSSGGSQWLLVLPVDMPLLSLDLFHGLIYELQRLDPSESDAISYENFEMPFIFYASRNARKVVESLIQSKAPSDRSIRSLLQRLKTKKVTLDPRFQPSMVNANLPSDWTRVCEAVENR